MDGRYCSVSSFWVLKTALSCHRVLQLAPKPHEIEAVRPERRRHESSWRFLLYALLNFRLPMDQLRKRLSSLQAQHPLSEATGGEVLERASFYPALPFCGCASSQERRAADRSVVRPWQTFLVAEACSEHQFPVLLSWGALTQSKWYPEPLDR